MNINNINKSNISLLFIEYLEYYGFNSSLITYKNEYNNRYNNIENENENSESDGREKDNDNNDIKEREDNQNELKTNIINKLLHLFNDGNTSEFFNIWNKYIISPNNNINNNTTNNVVNNTTQSNISEYKSIEFYLHIYFSIFPLLDRNNQLSSEIILNEMNVLKSYIELNSVYLTTSEFLPYFALPYVPSDLLYEHNVFKNLFQHEWIDKLRYRYEEFINDNITLPPLPKIYDLINNCNKSNEVELNNDFEKDRQISELNAHLDISSKKVESLMLLLKDISLCVYELSIQLVELVEYSESLKLDSVHVYKLIFCFFLILLDKQFNYA